MTTHRTRIAAIAVTGGAAVVLAACSSGGSSPSGATNAASTPPPSASATSAPAATGKSVTADLTEFHIALSSKSMKAGTYTFKVKNAGSITHALTVDGPGVSDKSTGDLSPGDTATLTVTLKAGSYDVFCPVGNHKMEGMDETVKVA